MRKLISQDVAGHVYVVECDDSIFLQTKLIFGKGGIDLYSYGDAVADEAKRLMNHPELPPRYRFHRGNVIHFIAHKADDRSKIDPEFGEDSIG